MKQYRLSNGNLRSKQHSHFLQGQLVARLDLNKFEAFQPYVKGGYQNTLHRSKSYLIETWNGWLVGAGGSVYGAEKWNAFINYEYNKMPTGDCQNVFMVTLAVNF